MLLNSLLNLTFVGEERWNEWQKPLKQMDKVRIQGEDRPKQGLWNIEVYPPRFMMIE